MYCYVSLRSKNEGFKCTNLSISLNKARFTVAIENESKKISGMITNT